MIAIVWAFIRPFAWKLALGFAIVVTILAVIARLKQAGRLQERIEAKERTIETVKRKKEIQHETRDDLRRTGESAADRLRGKWSRD